MSIEEQKKATRDLYYRQHACCPQCGSNSLNVTTIGFFQLLPDEYYDPNSATCIQCGRQCEVEDLVPAEPKH